MRERIKNYSSRITLDQEARDFIWQECQEYVSSRFTDCQNCKFWTRMFYVGEVSEELVGRVSQTSFSMEEMERFFGVSRRQQISLVKKGLSPVRLGEDGSYIYSRKAAQELLEIEELKNFYVLEGILEDDFLELERKNFPYWALKLNLGKIWWQPKPEEN